MPVSSLNDYESDSPIIREELGRTCKFQIPENLQLLRNKWTLTPSPLHVTKRNKIRDPLPPLRRYVIFEWSLTSLKRDGFCIPDQGSHDSTNSTDVEYTLFYKHCFLCRFRLVCYLTECKISQRWSNNFYTFFYKKPVHKKPGIESPKS